MRTLSKADAMLLLHDVGAPARLVRHVELVGEAAESILAAFAGHSVPIDAEFVRAAVVLHDIGKTTCPEELAAPGANHEAAGFQLLLEHGVTPSLARVCLTHAAWHTEDASLEERIVALADKLWKGSRVAELETLVIDGVADRLGVDRWTIFVELDSVFEEIASHGDDRLARGQL